MQYLSGTFDSDDQITSSVSFTSKNFGIALSGTWSGIIMLLCEVQGVDVVNYIFIANQSLSFKTIEQTAKYKLFTYTGFYSGSTDYIIWGE